MYNNPFDIQVAKISSNVDPPKMPYQTMPRSQEHLHVSMRSITAQPLGRVDNEQHQQCTENTTEVLRFMVSCQNKFQKIFELVICFLIIRSGTWRGDEPIASLNLLQVWNLGISM